MIAGGFINPIFGGFLFHATKEGLYIEPSEFETAAGIFSLKPFFMRLLRHIFCFLNVEFHLLAILLTALTMVLRKKGSISHPRMEVTINKFIFNKFIG